MRVSRPIRSAVAVAVAAVTLALPGAAHAQQARSVDDVFPYPDAQLTLVNHRGLSPGFPENTLAAFRNSIALGVDVIEIDLRPTADGEIVILHDDTVDRTTDGTGSVRSLTLEQVKALDAGSYAGPGFTGERIPTFAETLAAVQGTGVRLLLDIKDSSLVEQIVRVTQQYDMVSEVIVGPRDVAALRAFQALDPDLTTLGFIATPADADAFIAAGVDYIRLWPRWILPSRDDAACQADYAARVAAFESGERDHPGSASCIVEHVVSQGTPVWSTVNDLDAAGMDELLRLGVTGILSDLPAELDRLLESIAELRFVTAAARVDALEATLTAEHPRLPRQGKADKELPKRAKQLAKHLDKQVGPAIAARDTEAACRALASLTSDAQGTAALDLSSELAGIRSTPGLLPVLTGRRCAAASAASVHRPVAVAADQLGGRRLHPHRRQAGGDQLRSSHTMSPIDSSACGIPPARCGDSTRPSSAAPGGRRPAARPARRRRRPGSGRRPPAPAARRSPRPRRG
jgi:glycerophosphoryl diester phosphodiesterase